MVDRAAHSRGLRARAWLDRGAFALFAALALVVAAAIGIADFGAGAEQQLQNWRNGVLSHPASGKLGLVEIDAHSLKAFSSWPWPRGLHGRAVSALSNAGAGAVAFDVDFSAHSRLEQDSALAAAIGRAHVPVILPTFRQAGAQGSNDWVENLPLAPLREHALLASVNVSPDPDGFIRSNPYGVVTDGVPRPSMAAMLAGASGRMEESFPIDGAIDPATIPRVSFADLVNGRVPASALRGRNFLIGATAVEMGDRYAVPGHGVLPGALVQLMAAETLIGGTIPTDHGWLPALLLLAALVGLRAARRLARHPVASALVAVALLALPLALQAMRLGVVEVVPALAGLAVLAAGDYICWTLARLHESRFVDPQTGLANARALRAAMDAAPPGGHDHVVVLRLANYADALVVLGPEQIGAFLLRVAQRLGTQTLGDIHRTDADALGWFNPGICAADLTAQIEGALALLNQPVEADGRPLRVVPAIGVAGMEGGASRALDRALLAADQALARGARWGWYDAASESESDWRVALASEVEAALASGQIYTLYQPQHDMKAGVISSAEALVRWAHPTRGAIPPESLVALVEEHGLILKLTLHVLKTALEDQRRWAGAGVNLRVAVNVSALLPTEPGFLAAVEALLREFPGAAGQLTLEVTESATMIDADTVVAALEHLTSLGITISIDDYGTGQSTLTYLKTLPAREIKIDKSFVVGMETSRSDQMMVTSTIALAHQLGYEVVAEGVEDASLFAMLAEAGCDIAQGWHIGRPMTGDALLALVTGGARAAA